MFAEGMALEATTVKRQALCVEVSKHRLQSVTFFPCRPFKRDQLLAECFIVAVLTSLCTALEKG